jgi:hypothetical protein
MRSGMMILLHQKALCDKNAIDRAARLRCGLPPCGTLQFIRAAKAGGFLEGFL